MATGSSLFCNDMTCIGVISVSYNRREAMKHISNLCSTLLTQSNVQTIKVGIMVVPVYALLWCTLKAIDLFSRSTHDMHSQLLP